MSTKTYCVNFRINTQCKKMDKGIVSLSKNIKSNIEQVLYQVKIKKRLKEKTPNRKFVLISNFEFTYDHLIKELNLV